MQEKKLPFNISILSNAKSRIAGLLPIQVVDIHDSDGGDFHPQGLFSSQVFGKVGEHIRQARHGYIDMRSTVMHPKIYLELTRLKAMYRGIMSGSTYATWNAKLKDFERSDALDGETGYGFFMTHFHEIKFIANSSDVRDLRIKLLNKERESCMTRYLIVLPAGLRDYEMGEDGNPTEDDINGLYRKILHISNTIAVRSTNPNDSMLDVARWNLQRVFNEIYEYIETIISGKKGFILDKWSSRKVHNATRNVITANDPSPEVLGDVHAPGINDSILGLHQYMKATVELTIHGVRTGMMSPILDALPGDIPVIDPKTLKTVTITASPMTREKWGTDEAIEKLINGYVKLKFRHRPVMIDGYYVALIYRDEKSFKILHDISELPEGYDKSLVRPVTWTELFYLSVYKTVSKTICYNTRYPIVGDGSIYPSSTKLLTTSKVVSLVALDHDWTPMGDEYTASVMPIMDEPFFDSAMVHVSRLGGLQGDHDGDVMSFTIVYSTEAVKEGKDYLMSVEQFLTPTGTLRLGVQSHISKLVLHNFTRSLMK